MSKKEFTIVYNLETLDKSALEKYMADLSEWLGLPPGLNGLALRWMDDADGRRKLVAYAHKGTTDILRAAKGIEVTSLTPLNLLPSAVVFQAVGKDRSGRQEIAIGAATIEGRRGEQLAYAVMTAQTRACRRLTLQFVGGGILDESEVGVTSDIAANPASLAELAGPPLVVPPPPTSTVSAPPQPIQKVSEASKPAPTGEGGIVGTGNDLNPPLTEKPKSTNVEQFLGQQSLIDEAWKQLNAKIAKKADTEPVTSPVTTAESTTKLETKAVKKADIEPAQAEYHVSEVPATLPAHSGTVLKVVEKPQQAYDLAKDPGTPAETAETKPKKAKRVSKKREKVDLKAPEQLSIPIGTIDAQGQIAPLPLPPAPAAPSLEANVVVPVTVAPLIPSPPLDFPGKPTPEQKAAHTLRLKKFREGMPPSLNVSKLAKAQMFIEHMTGTPLARMTAEQWDKFCEFVEGFATRNTMDQLYKYVNDTLGMK